MLPSEMSQRIEKRQILARAGFYFDPKNNRYFHTRDASIIRTYLDSDALLAPKNSRRWRSENSGIICMDDSIIPNHKSKKQHRCYELHEVLEYIKSQFPNQSFTKYDLTGIQTSLDARRSYLYDLSKRGDIVIVGRRVHRQSSKYALPEVATSIHHELRPI